MYIFINLIQIVNEGIYLIYIYTYINQRRTPSVPLLVLDFLIENDKYIYIYILIYIHKYLKIIYYVLYICVYEYKSFDIGISHGLQHCWHALQPSYKNTGANLEIIVQEAFAPSLGQVAHVAVVPSHYHSNTGQPSGLAH